MATIHRSHQPSAISHRILLCLALTCLLAGAAHAQCRVEGVVRSAEGASLGGVTVQLDGPDYRQPLVTTTDTDGRYAFANVKAGTRVRVVALRGGRQFAHGYTLVTLFVENLDLREEPATEAPASLEYVIVSEGPSGEVAGFVVSDDGTPVPAARITLGDTTLTATTDASGRYLLAHLRPGIRVALHVSAPGFRPESKEVAIPEGERLGADFTLAAETAEERMRDPMSMLESSADGTRITLSPDRVAAIPSLDRKDVFRALQFLPGVVGTTDASTDLYVRGGSPDQSLVTIDGFTLYQFLDLFGAISAYNMDTVQRADFSRSPFAAGDGGRLAGALRFTGRANPGNRPSGFVDLSVLGGGGLVDVPIGDRASILIAARRSPPTSLYNNVLDRFAPGSGVSERSRASRFSGGLFQDAPSTSSFRDVNGRLALKLTDRDRLSFTVYDGRDDANTSHDLSIPSPPTTIDVANDSGLPSDAVVQVSNAQRWTARGLSGIWTRTWSPVASTTVSFGRSDYARRADQAWIVASQSTGADDSFVDSRGGSAALAESNDVRETTVRIDNSLGFGFAHAVSVGGELSSFDVAYSSRTEAFRTASGGAFASSFVDLLHTAGTGRLTAVYAQDAWRPFTRVILSPGVRLTRNERTGSTYVEPRASASYQLLPQVRLNGGWSIDHQVINRITREDRLHGDGAFWALADGVAIPVARAQQVVAGARADVPGVMFGVEAYYKALDDLTMFAPRLHPGIAAVSAAALLYRGSGKARGVEAHVEQKNARNTLWASYTLSRIEYAYPTLERSVFPASHDRTNEIKIVDSIQIRPRWSVTGAWVVGSGQPYTPASNVEHVWFPSGATVDEVTFGAKNSARLPAYHRLDVSTERDFLIGAIKSSLGATIFNVYDQKNISFYEYDGARQTVTANEVTLMRRAVNVFVRVGF